MYDWCYSFVGDLGVPDQNPTAFSRFSMGNVCPHRIDHLAGWVKGVALPDKGDKHGPRGLQLTS